MSLEPLDLGDHLLWPDGDISVDPSKITDYIFKLTGKGLHHLKVTDINQDIKNYNLISETPLSIKEEIDSSIFPPSWSLPEKYLTLDIDEYLFNLIERVEKDDLYDARVKRLSDEIFLYKQMNLESTLRALIYIVDIMKEKNKVWGVGRGSSCSSYLLFLLGLHCVDCVKYDIDISDFLRI